MLQKRVLTARLIILFFAAGYVTACKTAPENVIVTPAEIDSSLVNPGRGFTSTGNSFNENFTGKLHPLSGIHQQRIHWDKLEPEEGKINFGLIDTAIARSVRNGQLLNFRVMCQDVDMTVPKWALDAGVASPFYDNPVFIEKQVNLIKALGERYDGHPGVCFVDIGTIGQWGEWHVDPDAKDPKKIVYPSLETVKTIINAYFSSFKKTPLVALIAFKEKYGFEYATSHGSGWRADCWGDMDTLGWNHMKGVYPPALDNAKAHDSWKNGPVAFETCWTMKEWHLRGWDLDYILNKALEWHATGVNNGSEEIPEDWFPKVKEFEKRLGYRLVLDTLSYPSEARSGQAVHCVFNWQNKGVAPLYKKYHLAFQLILKTDPGKKITIVTDADLKELMPGITTQTSSLKIPEGTEAGEYELELGVLDPSTKKPAISLAIAGKTMDGWYKMGSIKIIN